MAGEVFRVLERARPEPVFRRLRMPVPLAPMELWWDEVQFLYPPPPIPADPSRAPCNAKAPDVSDRSPQKARRPDEG